MSWGYPDGCTQAMHDRAHGAETREECQTCDGTGVEYTIGEAPGDALLIEKSCSNCNGTGYEPEGDTREDDAYDDYYEALDEDVEF